LYKEESANAMGLVLLLTVETLLASTLRRYGKLRSRPSLGTLAVVAGDMRSVMDCGERMM
jgi:hypothetical protein